MEDNEDDFNFSQWRGAKDTNLWKQNERICIVYWNTSDNNITWCKHELRQPILEYEGQRTTGSLKHQIPTMDYINMHFSLATFIICQILFFFKQGHWLFNAY